MSTAVAVGLTYAAIGGASGAVEVEVSSQVPTDVITSAVGNSIKFIKDVIKVC